MNLQKTAFRFSIALMVLLPVGAQAGAIHDIATFTANTLDRNDDGSTGAVSLGFAAAISGTSYTTTYVNNNGNVTFGQALATYTPSSILGNPFPIIAAFWADVDTRNTASGVTQYGTGLINGRKVFGVNWIDVGYFSSHSDKLNSFQLILTDRSDIATGDFDIQFNYDKILWETGDASGGSGGIGGTPAAVGYAVSTTNAFQLTGSFTTLAFLNGGTNSLIGRSLGSNILGQYNFQVRGGLVSTVPEPQSWAFLALGLSVIGFIGRRRNEGTIVK